MTVKTVKNILCFCLALCLLSVRVSADLIWEPDDDFFRHHRAACRQEDRAYWVNSPEGFATLWRSPGEGIRGREAAANLPNGERIFVQYVYSGAGGSWGLIRERAEQVREDALRYDEQTLPEDAWGTFWVPMEHLTLYYDSQCFLADQGEAVRETARQVDLSGLRYCIWEYPGGPLQYQIERPMDTDAEITALYTDAAGREWGFCPYFYDAREIWFCLSDLENPDLPVEDRTPELYPAAGPESPLPEGLGPEVPGWVIAGVAAVCGVTAVLLLRMRRRGGGEER